MAHTTMEQSRNYMKKLKSGKVEKKDESLNKKEPTKKEPTKKELLTEEAIKLGIDLPKGSTVDVIEKMIEDKKANGDITQGSDKVEE